MFFITKNEKGEKKEVDMKKIVGSKGKDEKEDK